MISWHHWSWTTTLEAARKADERSKACAEVGLEANAAKHADLARRRRAWAAAQMCAARRGL